MRNHKKLTRDIILEFFKWINGNKRLKKKTTLEEIYTINEFPYQIQEMDQSNKSFPL